MYTRTALLAMVVVTMWCTGKTLEWIETVPECSSRNSCKYIHSTLNNGTCRCDPACTLFSDCCLDSPYYDKDLQISNFDVFKCVSLESLNTPVYMMDRCMEGWGDAYVQELCESDGRVGDPLTLLPVTSTNTNVTYPNYYCAICNEDSLTLRVWDGGLICDTLPFDYYLDLNTTTLLNNLTFENNTWGVLLQDGLLQDFHPCNWSPQQPKEILNLTRSCSSAIKTCADDWKNETVASECQSYIAEVYHGDQIYRNSHCALCNGINNYFCNTLNFRFGGNARPSSASFSLIFDFTDPSGSNLVGSTAPCSATQIWDPFFKKCRIITCPNPDENYRYGECVPVKDVNATAHGEPTTGRTLHLTPHNGSNTTTPDINANTTNTSVTTPASDTSTTATDIATVVSSTNTTAINATTPVSSTNTTAINATTPVASTAINATIPVTSTNITAINATIPVSITNTTTTMTTNPAPTVTSFTMVPILFPEEKTPHISTPTHPTSTFVSSTNATPDVDYVSSTNTSSEFASCYKITLSEEEFFKLPNGTVYVEDYGRMYSEGEYRETEEGVLVCLPDTSSRKFSVVLGWVSLAGLGLSCTGLLLHLAAFILLPDLRNLSGRNLASLCLALLAAYITFLVNMLSRPGYAGCVTLAAAMYYFFVSSFTWMNAIAFDVWYTFHITKRELRVAKGAQWHRFLAYSLYSWLLPAAALLALVLVDQLEPHGVPEQFLPRLGLNWCWFSHRKALLVFFAAPMVVIIIINCALFILTAAVITKTTSTTTVAVTGGIQHRDQFKMYLRLAVLMGFTWISGIAAGYLGLEALWYIFVVLNTLQGVFIFLAFTCRTKVWRGVGVTCRRALQRGISKMTRRPQASDTRTLEMSHTPERNSYTPPTSLESYS